MKDETVQDREPRAGDAGKVRCCIGPVWKLEPRPRPRGEESKPKRTTGVSVSRRDEDESLGRPRPAEIWVRRV